MKKTTYRCLVCSDEFESREETEFHIEHGDEAHQAMLNKVDLPILIQERTVDEENLSDKQVQITIEEASIPRYNLGKPFEWVDDKKLPYPSYPYYFLSDTSEYACLASTHEPFKTSDLKAWLSHLMANHSEDMKGWLHNHLKASLVKRIRHERGSSERLSDEDLERMATEELDELMITAELTSPEQPERMSGIIDARNSKIAEFLQGKLSYCPVCGLTGENLSANDREAYYEKLILEGLKPKMNLSGKEKYDALTRRLYGGTINNQAVSLCLKCNMHLHLRHEQTYLGLLQSKTLDGDLPKYLASKSYLPEKNRQELSTELKGLKPAKESIPTSEKAYLDWLAGKKSKKPN